MKLRDYLDEHDMTLATFAGLVGCEHSTISRYITGRRRPNWDALAKIEEVTKGKVTARDFMPAA